MPVQYEKPLCIYWNRPCYSNIHGLFIFILVCAFATPLQSQYTISYDGDFDWQEQNEIFLPLDANELSSALPIGFSFNYFGTTYTQFFISSNGFITFDPSAGSGPSAQVIPDAANPNNLIGLGWGPLQPDYLEIYYETIGTAPTRSLVVSFIIENYGDGGSCDGYELYGQIVLKESSHIIEIHTDTWYGDECGVTATQGIENGDGTIAFTVPGRNAGLWNAFDEFVAFIPSGEILDLAVTSYSPTLCPGQQDIVVTIQNLSTVTVDSIYLDWTWGGVPQTELFIQTPLAPLSTMLVTLGQKTLIAGEEYDLVTWSYNPDNGVDAIMTNDTLTGIVSPGLSGIKTIGGSMPDYPTLADAITALETTGVCDSVIFDIRPGTYTEELNFNYFASTPNSYAVFRSETGNAQDVIISQTYNAAGANRLVEMNNVLHVDFRNLRFRALGTQCSNLFYLNSYCADIAITNCELFGSTCNANSTAGALVSMVNGTKNDITLADNLFRRGSYGIYVAPGSLSFAQDVSIVNNQIDSSYRYGVYVNRGQGIVVHDNTIFLPQSGAYGIELNTLIGEGVVSHNFINVPAGLYGCRINGFTDNNGNDTCLLVNNMITLGGSQSNSRAMSIETSSGARVFHNSIHTTSSVATGIALLVSSNTLTPVKNNIISNAGIGKAANFYNSAADYNVFYNTTGPIIASGSFNFNDFSHWVSLSGQDVHSLQANPNFVSNNDLHTNAPLVNGRGTALTPPVSIDFDGETRNATNPDPGADEFGFLTDDIAVAAIRFPGTLVEGANEVTAIVTNMGTNTVSTYNIGWSYNAMAQAPALISESLAAGMTDTISLGEIVMQAGSNYTITAFTFEPNGNTDNALANDTFDLGPLYPMLNGTYTVGGTAPDFTSIINALEAIQYGGVIDSIGLAIRNGIYHDPLVPGIATHYDCNKPIRIYSESGNPTDVLFDNANVLSPVVKLDNVKGFHFENITFALTGSDIHNVVLVENGAACNSFTGCIFNGRPTTQTTSAYATILCNANQGLDNDFYNNQINLGSYGLITNGPNIASGSLVDIEGNTCTDNYLQGISATNSPHIRIIGNSATITSAKHANYSGIYANSCRPMDMSHNTVINLFGGATAIGFTECDGTSQDTTRVYNNYVYSSTTNNLGSVFSGSYSNYVHIANNTSRSPAGRAAGFSWSGNFMLENNVFQTMGNNPVLELLNMQGTDYISRNNCLHAPNGNIGEFNNTQYATLAQWQTLGFDLNSIDADPLFDGTTHHVRQIRLDSIANPYPFIFDDIDGDSRHATDPDLGADEFTPSAHDGELTALLHPLMPFPAGSNPVYVRFFNNGGSTLTSLQFNWSINDTLQTPFTWYGILPKATQYDSLEIGSYVFSNFQSYDIKAWISLPNGMSDAYHGNDTVEVNNQYAGLLGNYTIGGTEPDFETITAAVAALNQSGAAGPVTFTIRSGTYAQPVLLNDFAGSNCDRPVIFQSETENAGDVTITNLGINAHTVVLNGADGVEFRNLTLVSVNTAFRHAVQYSNGSHCNTFADNNLIGFQSTATANTSAVVRSLAGQDTANVFTGNIIKFGSYGFHLTGSAGLWSGITISGNDFQQNYYRAIYGIRQNGISITHNNLVLSGHTALLGMEIYESHGLNEIAYNKIVIPIGNYGILVDNCDQTATTRARIYNNFVSVGGTGIARPLYVNGSAFVDVYHNNLNAYSTNATLINTAPIYVTNNPSLRIINNAARNTGPGYAIYSSTNTTMVANNNAYHTAGTTFGFWNAGPAETTFALWQAASGQDANSININPSFVANTDLHTFHTLLNGTGQSGTGITVDFDQEPRNSPPDIGADEFDPRIANDAGVFMLVGPTVPFASGARPVEIALKNFGSQPLTSVSVRWLVNGIEQTPFVWTGSLPTAQCDTTVIGTYNFPEHTAHDLIMWTELPNLVQDSVNNNDTLHVEELYPALQGTYSVGGVLPDFNLFSQLQQALSLGGIIGNVTFQIRDGLYASQLLISDFPRISGLHTVTFTSESVDSSAVTLTRNFNAPNADNYTVRLQDAHRIRFEHITIASTKGRVFDLLDGTSDVRIRNCRISGVENASGSGDYHLVYSGTSTEDSIVIENNLFEDGDHSIRFTSSAGDREQHIRITGNTFVNGYYEAVYCQYTDGLVIQNNTIINSISRSSGISLSYAYGSPVISGNDIRLFEGTQNAISVHYVFGIAGTPARIFNNYIYCTGGSSVVGIRQQSSDHVSYNYNTVRLENSGSGSLPFYDQSSYANIHIRNCIFANYTGGLAMHVSWPVPSMVNSVNYTNLYTTGAQLIYYFNTYTSLAAFQTTTGQNLNGKSAEPLFASADPYVFQAALNNSAQVISGITVDMFGNPRHVSTPDIGAIEFTLPPHDIGAKLLAAPETYCGLSNSESVTIRIQNYGANTETGFTVGYRFGENAWVTENVGVLAVTPGGVAEYTFSTSHDLSQPGSYSFDLFTTLGSDVNSANDTIYDELVVHIPALTSPPTNLIPVDDAVDLDKTVSLSWSPAPHATLYDLYVWKISDPEPSTPQVTNLAQINRNYSSLDYGNTYNWKVIAKNSCNQMISSAIQQFTVRTLPDLVVDTVISPVSGYTGQLIDLEWITENIGTGGTQNALWSDAVYLSTDATLNHGLDIYLGAVQNLTALPSGQSYTASGSFMIPNNTVGNYYVFVHADRYNNVVESQNGNNWSRSAAIAMIELSPLPDLDAVDVVPTALAYSGQPINVLYTIENIGTAATGLKTWHDRIWLTTDPANPGQHLLGTIPHTANLAPDSSYTKNLQFTIPNGIFGNYYVHVRTDFHNVVYEFAAESNNQLVSDTIQILLNPPADFLYTGMNMADTLSSDFPNPISWTITNQGAGPTLANYWKDDLYISPAPVFNPNFNQSFKTRYHYNTVPSLASYTKNEYSNKMLLPAGWYYIYGVADSGNHEYEYNMESNNQYAYPSPVYIGNPDVIVDQPVCQDTVVGTTPFALQWKQINQGHGRYEYKQVRTRILGSSTPVYDPETAILIYEHVVNNQSMASLDTIVNNLVLSMPPQLSEDIYLHFYTDATNKVYEHLGDSNNIYSWPAPIYVSPPPLPDLEVFSVTTPDTVTAGHDFVIQYGTQNTGNLDISRPWQDDVYISFDSIWVPAHASKLFDVNQQTGLAAGDTLHTAVFLNLDPQTNENVYYLYIRTDEASQNYEGAGETNNIYRSIAFYVRGAPVSDLVLDTIEIEDTTYFAGHSYGLLWQTTVLSNLSPVIRNWKDYVYLSTDQVLDTAADIRVGIFSPNTQGVIFDQDHPFTQTDNIEIPVGLSGNYYLIGISDATGLHHDTVRENNIQFARDNVGQPALLNVQIPPLPDLIISDFNAPVTTVINQPTSIEVCLSNIGNNPAYGPWENQVYLSTDNTINSGDLRLKTFNAPSTIPQFLHADSSVCISLEITIPAGYTGNFYLIARTDPLNRIYEFAGENNNITLREIEVTQPLPSDLIVSEVIVPLEAIAGDSILISWKTKNVGTNPAYGTFREVVYLSPDTTWSIHDPVFGTKNVSGYFAPQSTSNSSLTERVSDVTEGDYFAIVRTDVQQQLIESNDANNEGASIDAIQIDVRTLVIDSVATNSLSNDAVIYYKIEVLPGNEEESMLITLQGDSLHGLNELYVKFESIPTRGDFDFGPQQSSGGYQHVIIPSLAVGTYYITGYCRMQSEASQTTELLATLVPFEILSISPNTGVQNKKVTVEIRGIKLDQTERFRLRRSDPWFELIAEQVFVRNDNRVYATFDLTGVPIDTYQLDGVKLDQALAVAPEPFIVVESGEPDLQITAFAPSIFNAAGSPSKLVINFLNAGDVDVIDAVVEVESPYGNRIAQTLEEIRNGAGGPLLELPLHEPNGPPGIIRPGGSGTVEVYVWSTPGPSFVVGLKDAE